MPLAPHVPVLEVHVAANVLTLLRFDAPLDRDSVELEGRATRFRLVDVGEQLIGLEPVVEPSPGEHWSLRVRYQNAASPAFITFSLVSHPTRVDKEVEVVRRLRAVEDLEVELAKKEAQVSALQAQGQASTHAALVFSGRLDMEGVTVSSFRPTAVDSQRGLVLTAGKGYHAASWALVVVQVSNLPGQRPWRPGDARLTQADGSSVKVRSVDLDRAELAPGETGLVAVETAAPSWKWGESLRLELLDPISGRPLLIPNIKL